MYKLLENSTSIDICVTKLWERSTKEKFEGLPFKDEQTKEWPHDPFLVDGKENTELEKKEREGTSLYRIDIPFLLWADCKNFTTEENLFKQF